eukprot:CFRG4193T1
MDTTQRNDTNSFDDTIRNLVLESYEKGRKDAMESYVAKKDEFCRKTYAEWLEAQTTTDVAHTQYNTLIEDGSQSKTSTQDNIHIILMRNHMVEMDNEYWHYSGKSRNLVGISTCNNWLKTAMTLVSLANIHDDFDLIIFDD